MNKDGTLKTHLGVVGFIGTVKVPACGAWSRKLARSYEHVTCPDCKATLDYAMAGGNR